MDKGDRMGTRRIECSFHRNLTAVWRYMAKVAGERVDGSLRCAKAGFSSLVAVLCNRFVYCRSCASAIAFCHE